MMMHGTMNVKTDLIVLIDRLFKQVSDVRVNILGIYVKKVLLLSLSTIVCGFMWRRTRETLTVASVPLR
jgi:hypothetical protein